MPLALLYERMFTPYCSIININVSCRIDTKKKKKKKKIENIKPEKSIHLYTNFEHITY